MLSDLKIFLTKDKLAVLDYLSNKEKAILREFIIRDTLILKFIADDTVVQELVKKRILVLYSPIFKKFNYANKYYPFKINRYAKKALDPEKHLGISSNPSKEEIALLADQRPFCMKYVKSFF